MRLLLMGADVVAAARPATPVQLTHACLRLGYDSVIPASWGDELVAAACIRELSRRSTDSAQHPGPTVLSACPHVARRVLANGAELRELLLPLAPPPVALARYLRALAAEHPLQLTWVGECPAADDAAIDERLDAGQLFAALRAAGAEPVRMPLEFEDMLPPDRRRHLSQPGGIPTAEAIAAAVADWKVVDVEARELPLALAELLLSDEPLLVDIAPRVGCRCTGAQGDCGSDVRDTVAALEPPRSPSAVVDHSVAYDSSYVVPEPVALPTDVRVEVGRATRTPPPPGPRRGQEGQRSLEQPHSAEPAARPRSSVTPRSIVGTTPTTRTPEGRSLPRAYVSRRRHTPSQPEAPATAARPTPAKPLLYGGHSGPLGRLTRDDQQEHRGESLPATDTSGRTRLVLLFSAVAMACALVGTLLGWFLRG